MTPEGPEVEPVGRHIQYLYLDGPHGLTDRLKFYFRPLVALGQYLNATVHIKGGRSGPRLWLHQMHTVDFAPSWDRYFNLDANGGNPFHELVNFRGCRSINASSLTTKKTQKRNWDRMFEGGVRCVNIVDNVKGAGLVYHPTVMASALDVTVSSHVLSAARRFLWKNKVSQPYGSVHVRRCDRWGPRMECTSPDAIYKQVAANDRYETWLVFMYAEKAYADALRARLAPLKRKFLFEDDVVLNPAFPTDNYFTYLVGKYLSGGAETIVETHMCGGAALPKVLARDARFHGVYLERRESPADGFNRSAEEAFLETEGRYEAVCGDPQE